MSGTWLPAAGMTSAGKRAMTWPCAGVSWASGTRRGTACRRAMAIDPRRAEIAGLIGRLHYEAREWREAVAYLSQAAGAAIPEDVTLFLDPREYREIPADFLALSLHHLGEHEEAVRWGALALAWAGRAGTDRLRNNAWWYRRRARRLWFFALGHTPEPVYGSMLERIGAGGVETAYIELSKALQALGQECFVFCRCAAEHVVDGVRFVPWERMRRILRPESRSCW